MTDTASPDPARYPRTIRILHWVVVALVSLQYLSGSGMEEAFPERVSVGSPTPGAAVAHALVGLSILLVMIWRLKTRWESDVPPPPSDEPRWLQRISRGTHYAFYIVLIGMPLAGATALLTKSEAIAEVHALTSWLLLALVVAHVAGAIWHISKGDGIIHRVTESAFTGRNQAERDKRSAAPE